MIGLCDLKNPEETSKNIEDEDWVQSFTSKVATVHLELLCDGFFTWQVNEDDQNCIANSEDFWYLFSYQATSRVAIAEKAPLS